MQDSFLLRALAQSLLAGEPTVELLVDRCSRTLGKHWRWLRPLALRYLKQFGTATRPRHRDVQRFLRNDAGVRRALLKYSHGLSVSELLTEPQPMQPASAAAAAWEIPAIESPGDLAKWLGLDPGELRWFADLRGLGYKENSPQLRHYHYRVLAKRFGSVRLIEAPKPRLKDLQRQILLWILEKIPPHPAVHGFVKGRSIKTFVAPHVGQRVVLRMDLRDFFPTFGGARIQSLFRTLGYPERVADLLGGICTNAAPRDIWDEIVNLGPVDVGNVRRLYSRPHLPQGAPTSPTLANICCYRLDCRLTALAKSAGANCTRYADDLAFSGGEDFEKSVERFGLQVAEILRDEGLTVHHRKTRVMRQGVRQHLAGLVTNRRANVARRDFDRLKAALTNCVRWGPESQNREGHPRFRAHLEGRVAFVEMINPNKGRRLRAIFEGIPWGS